MPLVFLVVLFLFSAGCSHTEPSSTAAKASADEAAVNPTNPDTITIPRESTMLQQIKVEPVQTASVPTDEVVAPGKIEVNPNRVSHVIAPVAGQVSDVLVKIGDFVRKGEPLMAIQSPDAEAALSAHLQAEAAVTLAKSAELKAEADYNRSKDLFQHEAIAQKDLLAAEAVWTQAKATTEQAVAVREQSKNRLTVLGLQPGYFHQPVVVRAPISGKVLEMSIVTGEYRNDTTAPLITVADLSSVWVSSDVPESYIRFIQLHEKVEISLVAYPGKTFEGRVSRIADTVNPQTRTVKVQAEIENPQGQLRPEMFASIHHVESMKVTPVLPPTAIVQNGGKSIVFVEVEPGRFKQTEVMLGKRTGDWIPVESGVKRGDRVVVDGSMLVKGLFRSLT
jgi:cobalt-zinc-cadmium efflux system membrane fusion protein